MSAEAQATTTGPSLPEAYGAFTTARPAYERTLAIDELRAREFARLDALHHVYLDYTGSGLYAASQVRAAFRAAPRPRARQSPFLEPDLRLEHAARGAVPQARARLLRRRPRRVRGGVHGQRQPRLEAGRRVLPFRARRPVPAHLRQPQLRERHPRVRPRARRAHRLPADGPAGAAGGRERARASPRGRNPGRAQPLRLSRPVQLLRGPASAGVDRAGRRLGVGTCLLDAAAFVPTNRLDLGRWHPDFVALSFYKMFGYPTGVGALLARKPALAKLHRPWFAGGTINVASVQADRFVLAAGSAAFEDGTLDFANIPAVELGLDLLESIGIDLDPRAGAPAGGLADRGAPGPSPRERASARAALRSPHDRGPRRHPGPEPLRRGRHA